MDDLFYMQGTKSLLLGENELTVGPNQAGILNYNASNSLSPPPPPLLSPVTVVIVNDSIILQLLGTYFHFQFSIYFFPQFW